MHSQAIAIDNVGWEDLEDPHSFTWGDDDFFSGTTQGGRHISIAKGQHSTSWELPTAETAHEHMVRQIVELLEIYEDPDVDFTLAWPYQAPFGEQRHFVGTRMDTTNEECGEVRWYSVLRVGDRADFTEHKDSASALEQALEEAAQLVDHVVAEVDGDEAHLTEAFLKVQIHQWHATLWVNTARELVAETSPCAGWAAEASTDLAQRLQLSCEDVQSVLQPGQA